MTPRTAVGISERLQAKGKAAVVAKRCPCARAILRSQATTRLGRQESASMGPGEARATTAPGPRKRPRRRAERTAPTPGRMGRSCSTAIACRRRLGTGRFRHRLAGARRAARARRRGQDPPARARRGGRFEREARAAARLAHPGDRHPVRGRGRRRGRLPRLRARPRRDARRAARATAGCPTATSSRSASRCATRSATPTPTGVSIATSSPPTCSSPTRPPARPRWPS